MITCIAPRKVTALFDYKKPQHPVYLAQGIKRQTAVGFTIFEWIFLKEIYQEPT